MTITLTLDPLQAGHGHSQTKAKLWYPAKPSNPPVSLRDATSFVSLWGAEILLSCDMSIYYRYLDHGYPVITQCSATAAKRGPATVVWALC